VSGFGADVVQWGTNSGCTTAVEQDFQGNLWLYSTCNCTSLNSFTGTNGFSFSAYSFSFANGHPLNMFYPASSEWATSVGATQFLGDVAPFTEIPAATHNAIPSVITSGGGFSRFIPRPTWQDAAVSAYLTSASLPPTGFFNNTGRGYPDITFNGHNYRIAYNSKRNSTCTPFCNFTRVDGTSASSPAVAGLFALINDALIAQGDQPLGFLNPLLYSMSTGNPGSFHDITSGDINSNEDHACIYGYSAQTGWDPVSGLGSIDFLATLNYIVFGQTSGGGSNSASAGSASASAGSTSDCARIPNALADAMRVLSP